MMEMIRERHPNANIHGGTVDVSAAYQQFSLTTEAAKVRSTIINIPYEGSVKKIRVVYLVGVFGDTRASFVYNTIGRALHYRHNLDRELERSKTYIDDGIVVDIESDIEQSIQEYYDSIEYVMGIGAAKDDKRVNYEFDLQAIGFLFNLRREVWRVGPKRRGILKMFLALFITFPINFTDEQALIRIQRIKLLQVASLINWYAQVIPAGSSFVHSLYRNAGWGADSTLVEVNINTKRDVHWWRLLIIASLKNPDLFSARISHLRINTKEDILLYTDASSEVGGGAWLSRDDGKVIKDGFIRWSVNELAMFKNHPFRVGTEAVDGVSINVLEFFAVFHFVLMWRHELKGLVIRTNCDNAATVAWLSRMRACGRSPVSESLMKLFSLVCLKFDIRFLSCHIAGILNSYADHLSRNIYLQESPLIIGNTGDKPWWKDQSAEVISRNFLHKCITQPWAPHSSDLLKLLDALQ
jgi:hypothetical protein